QPLVDLAQQPHGRPVLRVDLQDFLKQGDGTLQPLTARAIQFRRRLVVEVDEPLGEGAGLLVQLVVPGAVCRGPFEEDLHLATGEREADVAALLAELLHEGATGLDGDDLRALPDQPVDLFQAEEADSLPQADANADLDLTHGYSFVAASRSAGGG